MSYENPPVPHEVNVSRESVPAEFLRLLAGLALVIVLGAALLYLAGGWLGRQLPLSWERRLVGGHVVGVETLDGDSAVPSADRVRVEAYLDSLAMRLTRGRPLPDGMRVRLHLSGSDVPNAFATLGGHIVVTRGLYTRMPSENALAMVLAHEIGHVRHRDPIAAAGGGLALGLVLAALGDDEAVAGHMAGVVALGYSRQAERRADDDALDMLRAAYGHTGGAADVFRVLSAYDPGGLRSRIPTLLSTHPADAERIARIESASADARATAPLRERLATD